MSEATSVVVDDRPRRFIHGHDLAAGRERTATHRHLRLGEAELRRLERSLTLSCCGGEGTLDNGAPQRIAHEQPRGREQHRDRGQQEASMLVLHGASSGRAVFLSAQVREARSRRKAS